MSWTRRHRQRDYRSSFARTLAAGLLALGCGLASSPRPFAASPAHAATRVPAPGGCQLDPVNGRIKHVVFIDFDNVHLKRDVQRDGSANVPSDLEQIPSLLTFIKGNGVLMTNDHTPLISHTSDDIATSESGLYPSRHGVATSANSYYYYDQTGKPNRTSGFTYWTSKIGDGQYNFTSAPNTNAPAPWVPFTRAGCNVGAAAMSGLVLESQGDIGQAFGTGSPQYNDPNYFADEIGVAVHCGKGDSLCAAANGGVPDVLPNEPPAPDGSDPGYTGYSALYGSQPLARAINGGAPLKDINGNTIVDQFVSGGVTRTVPGFPGFSLQPEYALGYAADMLEHNVPVVFAYIITAHNPLAPNPYGYGHPEDTNAYSPGEAHYVDQLRRDYEASFAKFFARLASDGIDKSNTLFVVTTDEEDHHINGLPTPRTCDGVTVPCTYQQAGELNVNFQGLLQGETGNTTPVQVNSDDAPDFYLYGNPAPGDPTARAFDRALGGLTTTNPVSAALGVPASEHPTQFLADQAELRNLHMLTADPLRAPTVVDFAQPDYYIAQGTYTTTASSSCGANPAASCVSQNPAFNWNHGDVQPDITKIWAGFVGPGVRNSGQDDATFMDHVDVLPTMLSLTGLRPDTTYDGRPLVEQFTADTLPAGLQGGARALYTAAARVFKSLNAPVGPFGLGTLSLSTRALESGGASDDSAYTSAEATLTSLGGRRDALVARLAAALNRLAFDPRDTPGSVYQRADLARARIYSVQGQILLRQTQALVGSGATTSAVRLTTTSMVDGPELAALVVLGLGSTALSALARRRRRSVG